MFVIGVYSTDDGVSAHRWIELDGAPLEEHRSVEAFSVIYTYPGSANRSASEPGPEGLLTAALHGFRAS